jgi:phospholipase A1
MRSRSIRQHATSASAVSCEQTAMRVETHSALRFGGSLLSLLVAAASSAQSTASDCRMLTDDAARLACYDRLHGPPTANTPAENLPAVERREQQEIELQEEWFALTPHRTNYILPVTYLHNPDFSPYRSFGETDKIKNIEAKYQLSVRTLLWPRMFGSQVNTWFAFTLQSYWQIYSADISAPFRETNYEPELFVSVPLNAELFGWRLHRLDFGLDHQSNGRSEPLSRSWNRVVGGVLFEKGNAGLFMRTWWRIPESDAQDDNPHIERYMGQGQIGGAYRWGNQTFALIVKNNFRSEN